MVAFLADMFDTGDQAELSVLVTSQVCLIAGILVPTIGWHHRTDLASGKHPRYGVNVQLLVDLPGRLIAASQAFPGSWHDGHCLREAGWVDLLRQSGGGIGDLGYEGEPDVAHTPIKKRPHINLGDVERDLNRSLARVRVDVKWGIGHLKNRRILTTRYRSDLPRIDTDIQATVNLQKLNEQSTERPLTHGQIKAA